MFNPFGMGKDLKGMEKMVKPALEKFMKESQTSHLVYEKTKYSLLVLSPAVWCGGVPWSTMV